MHFLNKITHLVYFLIFCFLGSAFIAAGLVFLLPDPNKVQFN